MHRKDDEPDPHGVHDGSPAEEKVPGAQGVHDSAPAAEDVFSIHRVQLIAPPGEGEYVPARHCCGVAVPEEEQKYPIGQLLHKVAPAVEYFPGGHTLQLLAPPGGGEYVPAGHCPGVAVPVEQEYPAGQMSQAAAPALEYLPAAHGLQLVAPSGEYIPAGHWYGVAVPVE
jgi:hypothetical protein